MKMEYKLIKNLKKGFILTRTPETVDKELIISFIDVPNGATAIIENEQGNSLYRAIKDNTCSIPKDFIKGIIKVAVAVINGNQGQPKYVCEEIFSKQTDGGLIICPNGLDVPLQIVEICSQLQELGNQIMELSSKSEKLEENLNKLLDGYDFE